MHCHVIGRVALDFLLWIVRAVVTVYALNWISEATTRTTRPETRPASEFQLT
jgi:hypothetical protein